LIGQGRILIFMAFYVSFLAKLNQQSGLQNIRNPD